MGQRERTLYLSVTRKLNKVPSTKLFILYIFSFEFLFLFIDDEEAHDCSHMICHMM